MAKKQDDRWIDFSVLRENLNRILSDIPPDVIGNFLFVSPETVHSWRYGKRFPETPRLIVLAMLADQDILEFIGFRKDALADHEPADDTESCRRKDWRYETEKDLADALCFEQQRGDNKKIKTLEEFLLYLPLIPAEYLQDFLYRTAGEPTSDYLLQKLEDLYDFIPDCPSRRYADQYKHFFLEEPIISRIPEDTTLPREREKLRQFSEYNDSRTLLEEYRAYLLALKQFRLFEYQWFDERVEPTPELLEAFYRNTRGIVDQMVSLYIRLQYAYLMTSPRRKVDARFVDEVAKTYFPGVQKLLKNIADPETQREVQRRMEEANRSLKEDMDRLRQEKMMQELMESTVSDDYRSLQRNVVTNVKNKEQGYKEEQIIKAFRLVMERLGDMDEWKVTKVVLKELGYAPEKKKEKRTPVLSHEEMKAALLMG